MSGDVTEVRQRLEPSRVVRLPVEPVTAVLPPTAVSALLLAVTTIGAAAAALMIVEMPVRIEATGVLMPAGGFVSVVAASTGTVRDLAVREGQAVVEGQPLLRVEANDAAGPDVRLADVNVNSLEKERAYLAEARQLRAADVQARLDALAEQLRTANAELASTRRSLSLQRRKLELSRLDAERSRTLADTGHLAARDADNVESRTLDAELAVAELERRAAVLAAEVAAGERRRTEVLRAGDIESAESEAQLERLQREIARATFGGGQPVLAPVGGEVARVPVREGTAVARGQPLLKLQRANAGLEAWFYVPSTAARRLASGRAVTLRLDAYPREQYGTLTAVVSSVSRTALLPAELDVPLRLDQPVFEVRAALLQPQTTALGNLWPLATGLMLRADILEHRYRLYEWLFRSMIGGDDGP